MKKLLSVMLAAALTLSISVMSFASNERTIEASYTTGESYTVTIPTDQTVTTTSNAETVFASDVLLTDGSELVVTIKSENGYKLECEGSEIPYTVTAGGTTLSGTEAQEILTVESGSTSGSVTLRFKTTASSIENATKAGKHTDKLTFACSVNNAS